VVCEQPSAVPGMAGEEMVRAVTDGASRVYEGAIITLAIESGGEVVRVSGTPEHPFWCSSRHAWVPLGELRIGDLLEGLGALAVITHREVGFCQTLVYNFGVADTHTYRVSELGLLVHNYTSPGKMQKLIDRGDSPRGITMAHKGKIAHEKDHVHFKDGSALNRDGTVKHGAPRPSKDQKKWLEGHGWAGEVKDN
jgi:hypothetical protein